MVTTQAQSLIADVLAANGYELIETEYVAARELYRVFIDRPDSRRGIDLIAVEDCVKVSDLLQDALIPAGVRFEHLEVSSPGIDRALTSPPHFERFAGEVVKLTIAPAFNGLRKLTGELRGFEENHVVLAIEGALHRIPYENVARARVVPQY